MTTLMMTLRQSVFPVRENLDGDLEWRIDVLLLAITMALFCIGWVMVSSASIDYAWQGTGSAFYFSIRHGIYIVISLLVMALVTLVPFNVWRRIDTGFLILALVCLVAASVVIGAMIIKKRNWVPAMWTLLGLAAMFDMIRLSLVLYT